MEGSCPLNLKQIKESRKLQISEKSQRYESLLTNTEKSGQLQCHLWLVPEHSTKQMCLQTHQDFYLLKI